MRRLVANLDAESEWAAHVDPAATYRPPARPALEAAAVVGTLLRALAQDTDRLHLALPLDPERIARVPGLPRPHIESGPLEALEPPGRLLAWCETPTVAAHRGDDPSDLEDPDGSEPDLDGPLHEVLWRIPPVAPDVVARVHPRSFHLGTARELDLALPGARMLEGPDDLEAHLRAGGADASPTGRCVLKAPWSAAGRSRWIGSADDLDEPKNPKARRTVENLFRRHGSLLFEPWMDRTDDFGATALVGPDGTLRIVGVHRQHVDPDGRFVGLDLTAEGLTTSERSVLESTARDVGRFLSREGYTGPFGLDAYRHRDREGRMRLHPLGEINARMTVGLLAHALWDRLGASPGSLWIGPKAPGPEAVPLVHPAGGLGLWMGEAAGPA